jgi:hypothetical protein
MRAKSHTNKQNKKEQSGQGISYHVTTMSPLYHALATTIGGKLSGGRARFLPEPPPAAPPLAAAAVPPTPAPAPGVCEPFFFGVSSSGVAGIAIPNTTVEGGICGLSTGGVIINTGAGATGATASAAARTGGGTTTAGSFGFAFFFEPEAAAAIAALVGRITCPSGPSFVCAGFGGSSGSSTKGGAPPLVVVVVLEFAKRRS